MLKFTFAHAFGQRYELPIPLVFFLLGGAGVVLLSFILVVRQKVQKQDKYTNEDHEHLSGSNWAWAVFSFIFLALITAAGITGSQEIPENILPTLFWVYIFVAIPISCGVIGDWTQAVNPFANIAKLTGSKRLRKTLLGTEKPLEWPARLGWWPAATLFFAIVCGELIFNQSATKPMFIAWSFLVYFLASATLGLVYGREWLRRGEVFSVLFATWGRLGYFRFGAAGRRGFAGGLVVPFEASISRVVFVLLLLGSVSFDGFLSTPLWNRLQQKLPNSFELGTLRYELFAVLAFAVIVLLIWLVFSSFANAVTKSGGYKTKITAALSGLLPSLLPISFGYLLAHYLEYLIVNGQLIIPLIGNPTGKESWPIHLAYPFNDDYEIHAHALPSSFYWYFAVAVIVIVHIIAVLLAHRHLGSMTKNESRARRSEYPWVAAMILYTMLSLWLLAQPLVKEKTPAESYAPPQTSSLALKK